MDLQQLKPTLMSQTPTMMRMAIHPFVVAEHLPLRQLLVLPSLGALLRLPQAQRILSRLPQ